MSCGKPYTQLYYHLLWATYDRLPLIRPDGEDRLQASIRAKLQELRCETIALGGVEDHVHCVCRVPPSLSISHVVQQVKGASSHLMTHEIGERESFRWQGSYAAFTLPRNAVPAVRDYVLRQKEHHASGSLWPDWERATEVG
jgi:REP element-mobilizing transposase RayT